MPRINGQARPARRSETGGVTIIVALVLVSVMGAAVFGLSRSSLRELAISGSVAQGTKADKAADSGMDWFMTWAHPDNVSAFAGVAGAEGALAQSLIWIKRTDWLNYSYASLGANRSGLADWDRAVKLSSDSIAGHMVFDTSQTAVVGQNTGTGNAIVQKFDIELRFLGQRSTGGAGDPSGGTDPKAKGTMDLLWQVTSSGRADVTGANISFVQRREAIGVQSLSQD